MGSLASTDAQVPGQSHAMGSQASTSAQVRIPRRAMGSQASTTAQVPGQSRRAIGRTAYEGNPEFKEKLYVPTLPPVNWHADDAVSVLFPLMDVSGSMHSKLDEVKAGVCNKFLRKIKPTAIAAMGFTDKPHTFIDFSGISAETHYREIEAAINSLFIPSHSGTDIPAAVLALLGMLEKFFRPVNRAGGALWQTHCVIITDGIHAIQDRQWGQMQQACQVMRQEARNKRCIVFFHLLDLKSREVDRAVLDRLKQVLEAESAERAGPQVSEVCDTLSRHMVTLEKCVTELNEVKKEVVSMPSKAHFLQQTLPRFKKVKENVNKHQTAVQSFQDSLRKFEDETQTLSGSQRMVAVSYEEGVVIPTSALQKNLSELEDRIQAQHEGVHESMREVRTIFTQTKFAEHMKATKRIQDKLSRIETFVGKGSSRELQTEVVGVMDEVEQTHKQVAKFCADNKESQHMTRTLQAEVQRSRERAHRLQEKLKEEADGVPGSGIVLQFSCSICTEDDTVGFQLCCKSQHAFCVKCLAKHIHEQAKSNRAAFCPECPHELYETEVESICGASEQPEIAELYQKRCFQRRVQTRGSTLYCPKGCGNAIASIVSKHEAVCDECKHRFCPGCTSEPHPAVPDCMLFLRQQAERATGDKKLHLEGQLQTIEYLKQTATDACPTCKFPCQKVGGCDHVVCAKCRTRFSFGKHRVSQKVFEEQEESATFGLDLLRAVDAMAASASFRTETEGASTADTLSFGQTLSSSS